MDTLGVVLLVFLLGEITGLGGYLFLKVHKMDMKMSAVCEFLRQSLGYETRGGS